MQRRKVILTAVATIGMGAFLTSLAYFLILARTCPSAPDAVTGHEYQMNNHGHLFYVTPGQYRTFYSLCFGGWTLGASAAVLGALGRDAA